MKLKSLPKAYIIMLMLVVSMFHISCKKTPPEEPYWGHDYFPINKGHWVVYDVDSIYFNDFTGTVDTFNYQIKEVFGEAIFMGDEGAANPSYNDSMSVAFERFSRQSESDLWELNWKGFAVKHKQRLEKVENNQKFVKLIFPIRRNQTWKGNAFNNLDDWDYTYIEAYEALNLKGQKFDSTVTVLQIDEKNLIEQKKYIEIYARNIGLISKDVTDVKTKVDGTIKSGLKFNMRIKAYGE